MRRSVAPIATGAPGAAGRLHRRYGTPGMTRPPLTAVPESAARPRVVRGDHPDPPARDRPATGPAPAPTIRR